MCVYVSQIYSEDPLEVGGARFSNVHRSLAGVTQRHALKFAHAFRSHKARSAHRSISPQNFSHENGSSLSMQNHAGIPTGYETCALSAVLCLEKEEMCVRCRNSDL